MLFFSIKDYNEFTQCFGMRKTNGGEYVRKEKVTLGVLKDMFANKANDPERWARFFMAKTVKQPMSQADLIKAGKRIDGGQYDNDLMEGVYHLASDEYRVDSDGLCYDGDVKSIRYEHEDHIYKMKASKFFGKIWAEHHMDKFYGTKAGIYCGEKFAEAWTAYAESKVGKDLYTLHIGSELEDFERIYSSEKDLGSCMRNHGQYSFYVDAVDASAAWLEDKDGILVCRCVIFNNCTQMSTGETFRLAERQYAIGQDDKLKNILVQRLYAEGKIDAHKRVGASCWAHDEYVDRNGDELDDTCFSTPCHLEPGDQLSFQDSFAWFCYNDQTAYTYEDSSYDDKLDVCDEYYNDEGEYDEWEDESYHNEEMYHAYWWDGYGDRRDGQVAECNIDRWFICVDRGEYEGDYVHEDDVCQIGNEWWCKYDDDVVEIDYEWYLKEDVYYCDGDIDDWATDAIYWEDDDRTYANYSYSDLLEKDVPDDLFDEVEEEYAEAHGYVRDDDGEWVLAEELEEVVA